MDNIKVIRTEDNSGYVRELFCSIGDHTFSFELFKITENGCVVCVRCQNNYANILEDLNNVKLTSENFIYLAIWIGRRNHKSYQNRIKDWINEQLITQIIYWE